MKKLLIAALMILLTLGVFGCTTKDKGMQENSPKQNKPDEVIVEEFQPHLSGIKLGDSKDHVIQTLGTAYEETTFDEALSLGEPFVRFRYTNGITVVIGSDSKKVLEIETNSPATTTNLGFTVGDKAQDVLDEYRSKYKEPDSRHGDGKLIGWFLIKDQELVIFNFDKDESLVNMDVKSDALVERIKLTNFNYMD